MWFLLLTTLVVLFVLRTIQINSTIRSNGLVGPFQLPLVGGLFYVTYKLWKANNPIEGRFNVIKDNFDYYGDHWYASFGAAKFIFTSDPATVRWITTDNFANYKRWIPEVMGKSFEWRATKRVFGDGIFLTDDEVWSIQRKLATPLFKKNSLDFMKTVFHRKGVRVLNILNDMQKSGETFDAQVLFMRYTLDSFGEIGFGVEFDTLSEKDATGKIGHGNKDFPGHFDRVQACLSSFFWKPYGRYGETGTHFIESLQAIDDFVYRSIEEHRIGEDLLSTFLKLTDENGKPYPHKWIRDILINFTIAGRDTTALLLTWSTYLLATHPDVYRRVREEVLRVVPDDDTVITADHLKQMQLLDWVLQETLRIYPSVPMTSRIALKDDVLPNGMKVPAGTSITYLQYFLHRNTKYWDDPEKFIPERWEKPQLKDPFQYLPFHAGPMQCLGRHMAHIEAKMLHAMIIRRFRFELTADQKIIPTLGIVTNAYPGMKVTVSN